MFELHELCVNPCKFMSVFVGDGLQGSDRGIPAFASLLLAVAAFTMLVSLQNMEHSSEHVQQTPRCHQRQPCTG